MWYIAPASVAWFLLRMSSPLRKSVRWRPPPFRAGVGARKTAVEKRRCGYDSRLVPQHAVFMCTRWPYIIQAVWVVCKKSWKLVKANQKHTSEKKRKELRVDCHSKFGFNSDALKNPCTTFILDILKTLTTSKVFKFVFYPVCFRPKKMWQ